jgi:hypothetical protein
LGRDQTDPGVDRITVLDHGSDQFAGQRRGRRVALDLSQMAFEDRFRRPLAEVGFEDRGERESTARTSSPLPISLRRHRR